MFYCNMLIAAFSSLSKTILHNGLSKTILHNGQELILTDQVNGTF